MRFKKCGGRIFGVELSKTEEKFMDAEIGRQLKEWDKKHSREIRALILWYFYQEHGWRHDRLKRLYWGLDASIRALMDRYDMDDEDDVWLCTHLLKEDGIDLDKWDKEMGL